MHLTCTNMPVDKLKDALVKVGGVVARCCLCPALGGGFSGASSLQRGLIASWLPAGLLDHEH